MCLLNCIPLNWLLNFLYLLVGFLTRIFFFFLINDLVEDVVVVFIHFIDHTMMVSVGC